MWVTASVCAVILCHAYRFQWWWCDVKPRSLRLPLTNVNDTATKYNTRQNATHTKWGTHMLHCTKIWIVRIEKIFDSCACAQQPIRFGKVGSKCNNRDFINKIRNENSEYQFTPKNVLLCTSLRHITRGNVLETSCKKKRATPDCKWFIVLRYCHYFTTTLLPS
jgi:hypothetical protein